MAKKKIKSAFFCQNCGAQSPKWLGRCTTCKEWDTFVEENISTETSGVSSKGIFKKHKPILINDISSIKEERISSEDKELNRVLGGGIVPGSVTLLGGDPGIGKSTLLLQLSLNIVNKKILYVSGEESEYQIKMRCDRINKSSTTCYIHTETLIDNIFSEIEKINPDIVIIDSVQTIQTSNIESSPGSVSQIRECCAEIIKYAKYTGISFFLIGHINKDGAIAGPKILEHMVDTVLQFEGDRNNIYRILRSVKNRFGSSSEIGVYEMTQLGLREVNNPSEILISIRDENISGASVAATIEGERPIMIEIQALVSSAVYGTPQRSSTGYNLRRLNMLLAVLEKKCGFRLGVKDVFLNITGGIRIDDTAIDLAVICSILSSDQETPIDMHTCFAAEIGLSGEVRPVSRIEQRIAEAEKLGYKHIIISKYNKFNSKLFKIDIKKMSRIEEVFQLLF